MAEDELARLRGEIDGVTSRILGLLNERARIAQEICAAKKGCTVYAPAREARVLADVVAKNDGPLSDEAVQAVFKEVVAACRNLEQQLKVAYLGPAGTYSEEAARKHLGQTCDFVPFTTFDDVIRATEKGETDVAVVAVENSTEGGVNHTQDILLETSLKVCGEILLPVHHQLMSKAKKLEDIEVVAAHPQALAQCRDWLDAHLAKAERKAVNSNAEAAVLAIKETDVAAIASSRAGEIYGLPILAKNIEDDTSNTTRFLALSKERTQPTGSDKTSLICSVPNKPGSLGRLLSVLTKAGINMARLESRPAKSALWEYVFYIDIEGHEQDKKIAAALGKLRDEATFVKVLGSYPKAK